MSIGTDIIHKPPLLFLDEPTSGLDSTSAFSVIEKVRDIARGGSMVLLTIHQPSSRIQMLLDRITVLAKYVSITTGCFVSSKILQIFITNRTTGVD